jgi:hypothetical protein
MTVKDIFGLIVRIAGMTFIVFGLFDLVRVVATLVGLPMQSRYSVQVDATAAVFYFIFGVAFLVSAKLITRLVYGRDE